MGQGGQEQRKERSDTEKRWVVEVVGGGGTVEQELGLFMKRDQAEAREKQWAKEHPKDSRPTRSREITVRVQSPQPSGSKSQGDKPRTGSASVPGSAKRVVVRVYKLVDFKWVEQPERLYQTDTDLTRASAYFLKFKDLAGWTATWTMSDRTKPVPSTTGFVGQTYIGEYRDFFRFEANDLVTLTETFGNVERGTWKSDGSRLSIQIRNHWMEIDGTIQGDTVVATQRFPQKEAREGRSRSAYIMRKQ
jgi:hypothetical protein